MVPIIRGVSVMSEKKVTKHDLYEKLWASRDFEINHLWQRSIFLATFIVALFTIYFSVLNNFTSSKSVSEDIKIELVKSTESYEGYAIAQDDKSVLVVKDDRDESIIGKPCFQLVALDVICLFGFLFSVLWICMAKGSKYMYERHEGGIEAAHPMKSCGLQGIIHTCQGMVHCRFQIMITVFSIIMERSILPLKLIYL